MADPNVSQRSTSVNEWQQRKEPFNEAKVTQAAGRLLMLNGGTMRYRKLLKLLYLVDRQSLLEWGRSVTTDHLIPFGDGPILTSTLCMIKIESDIDGAWATHISKLKNFEVSLIKDTTSDELSKDEVRLIDRIYGEHGKKLYWEILCLMHTLGECKDPRIQSIPAIQNILKGGIKSPEDDARIEAAVHGDDDGPLPPG